MNRDREKYMNPYGKWRVTTEGDCEGKTTKYLGTYEGYIDEIAFSLADKCFYALEFKKIENELPNRCPVEKVHISLDIESGTWPNDMSTEERVGFFKRMLKDRDVEVTGGQFYASVCLHQNNEEIKKAIREKKIREVVLAKLTDEEKELLGLL